MNKELVNLKTVLNNNKKYIYRYILSSEITSLVYNLDFQNKEIARVEEETVFKKVIIEHFPGLMRHGSSDLEHTDLQAEQVIEIHLKT